MSDAKTAKKIYQDLVEEGRVGLGRASLGLAFSGLSAGLNLSFGPIAMFSVAAMTGEVGLAAMSVYPLGFLIVVLGRAQLFTETTVIPVTVVLKDWKHRPGSVTNLFRLWSVVLAANLVGAFIAAFAISYSGVLDANAFTLLIEEVSHKMDNSFVQMMLFGVYGGWVVAMMAWLATASQDTIGRAFVIWATAILIPAGSLPHCVAGSAEVLIGVFAGEVSWGAYFGTFLLPATLGNTLGGVVLVALLNYAQVAGSGKKMRFSRHSEEESQ